MHFFRNNFVSSMLKSSCINLYTAVLGFSILRRSISCIHAVVRVVLPRSYKKITIFRNTLMSLGRRI